MACMEHDCGHCGFHDFDNKKWNRCPRCGSIDVTNYFDEPPESFHDEPEDEEDGE